MALDNGWFGFGPAFVLGVISLLVYFRLTRKSHPNYPPGPISLPIIGNLLQIKSAKDLPTFLLDMRKVYGDCFRLYFGRVPIIIIFGYANIKKILIDDNRCDDRPSWEEKGILYASGKRWAELEKLIVSAQQEKCFQENVQRTIEEELAAAHDVMTGNIAVDPTELCLKLAISVISTLAFGERIDSSKAEFQTLLTNLDISARHARSTTAVQFLPFLACLPSTKSKKAKAEEADKALFSFLKLKLEQHKKNFDPSSIRDVMDMYIKHGISEHVDDEEFYQTCLDLFDAGVDGLASSFLSAIFFLVKYPDVQHRCREEISEFVSRDRSITLTDIHKLKYVTSTIKEFLRMSRTVATTVFRSTGDNSIKVGSYTIPPNHVVLFDLRDPHTNPTLWKDPEMFNPERWMTSDGQEPGNVPFGAGRRQCTGKDLAILALHFIMASLVKNFNIQAENETELTLDQVHTGTSMRPEPFKIKLTHLTYM